MTNNVTASSRRVRAARVTAQPYSTRASDKRRAQTSAHNVVKFLREKLGLTLTAQLADVNARTVTRWIANQARPREEAEKRLRAAYQIFMILEKEEAPPTVRAWFMGMNEQLDDLTPTEAIALGREKDALVAARAFVAYG